MGAEVHNRMDPVDLERTDELEAEDRWGQCWKPKDGANVVDGHKGQREGRWREEKLPNP